MPVNFKKATYFTAYWATFVGAALTGLLLVAGSALEAALVAAGTLACFEYFYAWGFVTGPVKARYLRRMLTGVNRVTEAETGIAGENWMVVRRALLETSAKDAGGPELEARLRESREAGDIERFARDFEEYLAFAAQHLQDDELAGLEHRAAHRVEHFHDLQTRALDRLAKVKPPAHCDASHHELVQTLLEIAKPDANPFSAREPKSAAEIANELEQRTATWNRTMTAYNAILSDLDIDLPKAAQPPAN